MITIDSRNANQALPEAVRKLYTRGNYQDTRNGGAIVFDAPVTTVYQKPKERVVFWPERDANPFFHLMESLWMLAGRNDVEFVKRFVKRMESFSDDGQTFNGAYGYRWRQHFGFDQINEVVANLTTNPNSRRELISMWDADNDLSLESLDLPCNLQALFQINSKGSLDMMVTNRSNDIVWGAYGANCVHFSYLQEYVATLIGVEVGRYYQVSFNLHAYTDTYEQVKPLAKKASDLFSGYSSCYYENGLVEPYPLISIDGQHWDHELKKFIEIVMRGDDRSNLVASSFNEPFFNDVAYPMYMAHSTFKSLKGRRKYQKSYEWATKCQASDWRFAAQEWVERRRVSYEKRLARAEDDGVVYD